MQEYDHEYAQFVYYTPDQLDKMSGLWPVRAGRSRAKPHYQVGPKRIECYSLHFIFEGRIWIEFGSDRVELQKGDLLCLFPGKTHHYGALPSAAPLRMDWLAVDGDRVESLLELVGITMERPYRRDAVSHAAMHAVERVVQALADADGWSPATALELQGLIHTLFAELVLDYTTASTAKTSSWIDDCIKYMELHAAEGITVQQVADYAGVHRSYFSKVFSDQVGIPPLKFMQKIRMEKAERLLRDSNATVTEIALSLGYPNLYTFTRAFKQYYNVSPLAVRGSK